MRGGLGNIKSSRDQNVSKKGSSHGNSEHEEIQLVGLMKNAAFVPAPVLNVETQGPPCLLFLTSFDRECGPHLVGLLIVL